MVDIGSGAKRNIEDVKLSPMLVILLSRMPIPLKEIVALGQTYFAVQTRRQELSDEFGKFKATKKNDYFFVNR